MKLYSLWMHSDFYTIFTQYKIRPVMHSSKHYKQTPHHNKAHFSFFLSLTLSQNVIQYNSLQMLRFGIKDARFLVHVSFLFWLLSSNSISISAKSSSKHRKQGKVISPTIISNQKGGSISSSTTFNVLNYGAKGDGIADDTNVSIYIYVCV